jgi:hypothetical protein
LPQPAKIDLTQGHWPLATLNVKDYEDFAQHEGLTLISQ